MSVRGQEHLPIWYRPAFHNDVKTNSNADEMARVASPPPPAPQPRRMTMNVTDVFTNRMLGRPINSKEASSPPPELMEEMGWWDDNDLVPSITGSYSVERIPLWQRFIIWLNDIVAGMYNGSQHTGMK